MIHQFTLLVHDDFLKELEQRMYMEHLIDTLTMHDLAHYTASKIIFAASKGESIVELHLRKSEEEETIMTNPMETSSCRVATFSGYVDDIGDISEDSQLKSDVDNWIKAHPEYHVYHVSFEPYGSSGYPMFADVYYTENAYGRQFVDITHSDPEWKELVLRNLETGHLIELTRFDRHDGSIGISIRDKDSEYIKHEIKRVSSFY
jgi:hypothetical protein